MKRTKTILFILLVIVTVAAVTFAAFVFGRNSSDTATTNPTSTSTNTQSQNQSSNTDTDTTGKCTTDDLALSTASNGGSGAGTLSFDLVFTNTSSTECTMAGYPGVSLVKANGDAIGDPATENTTNNAANVITLNAGQTAKAAIFYGDEGNYPASSCVDGATKLRVYPPGSTAYLDVATLGTTARCPKFEVTAVQ